MFRYVPFWTKGTPILYPTVSAQIGLKGVLSQSAAINSVTILQIRPYKSGDLSSIVPSEDLRVNLTFDAENTRRINGRTVEITRKSNGKITQTEEYMVSSDLKTLTRTVHVVGEVQPLITVFERVS